MLDKFLKRKSPEENVETEEKAKKKEKITKQQLKLIIILAIEFIAIALIIILIFFSGKKTHTVTFDLNGGILISGDEEQRVMQGHNATPPTVAKYGHYLRGWSGSYKSITQDVTIKAIWEYETSPGIEYSIPSNTNYCEISSTFKEIQGEIFVGSYYGDRKVLGIKSGAFKDRTGVTAVHLLDGILTIESEAFSGCTSLEVIDIPSTVVRIGKNAFKNCESLTTIVLPDGIKTIEEGAFEGCTSLTTIILPASLENVAKNSFKGCTALESLTICDGVKSIGVSAFAGCEGLKEIFIPRSVNKIALGAFTTAEMTISLYRLEEEIPKGFVTGWCPADAEFLYGVKRGEDDEPIEEEEEEEGDSIFDGIKIPGIQINPDRFGKDESDKESFFDKLFPGIGKDEIEKGDSIPEIEVEGTEKLPDGDTDASTEKKDGAEPSEENK